MALNIRHMLPQRATVLRKVREPDGAGGYAEIETVIAEGLPIRIGGGTLGLMSAVAERMEPKVQFHAWMEVSAPVQPADVLIVGGTRYNVHECETQADGAYRKARLEEDRGSS